MDPKAFPRFGFWVLAATIGCSSVPSRRTAVHAAPREASRRVQHAPARLEKAFTGQAQPSLTVKNGFPSAQHVFVDWVEQAVLAPSSSHVFELGSGTHTVTCSDSADPDDNPAVVTEAFDTGYAYRYEIRPTP